MDLYKKSFVGLIGFGTLAPALALFAGFPDTVCEGLGRPYESWMKSPEARFGLMLYTASDVALGMMCGISLLSLGGGEKPSVSPSLALAATAVHQAYYLAASVPVFGFRKEHIASIIAGSLAAVLACFE